MLVSSSRAWLIRSFPDAVVTIRRTGVEFQYQLVVTRAYEEGEEQLLEDDAESRSFVDIGLYEGTERSAEDERVFLIDEALGFRFGSLDGDSTCAWRDLTGDEGDLWEFVSSKASVLYGDLEAVLTARPCQKQRTNCLS